MDVDEINEEDEGVFGELANVRGERVASILSGKGRDRDVALASVISDTNYDFQPNPEVECVVIPFGCDAGECTVELELKK